MYMHFVVVYAHYSGVSLCLLETCESWEFDFLCFVEKWLAVPVSIQKQACYSVAEQCCDLWVFWEICNLRKTAFCICSYMYYTLCLAWCMWQFVHHALGLCKWMVTYSCNYTLDSIKWASWFSSCIVMQHMCNLECSSCTADTVCICGAQVTRCVFGSLSNRGTF